jgi:uncharacterized protein
MPSPLPWLILAAVLVGHFGFWLFWFNRLNATGLPRPLIKRLEKVLILLAMVIPLAVYFSHPAQINQWLFKTNDWWPTDSLWFNLWSYPSLMTLFLIGPQWLHSRLGLRPPKFLVDEGIKNIDVAEEVDEPLVIEPKFRICSRLPGNQLTHLTVTTKVLELPRVEEGVLGFRIGHLSDIHLTGKIAKTYYQFAIERLLAEEPQLIVISGDIIDYDRCLDWIEPVLGRLTAPHGCCFVLGNHDRRLRDIDGLVARLVGLGFHDLGQSDLRIETPLGGSIHLMGNERPWFERHDKEAITSRRAAEKNALRIGVSHSPDQIPWARTNHVDLLLAGHTHGGQIRIPGIGPIVAPSLYGSRFASGVFYLHPTLMHVSRGLCGVHPFRWFCPPEVSLLILRSPSEPGSGQ